MLEFLIFLVGAQFGVIGTIVVSLYMEALMARITIGKLPGETPKKLDPDPMLA